MAEETEGKLVATPTVTPTKKSDFWIAQGSGSMPVPEAASQRLTWKGEEKAIDYIATAGHVDVRDDTGRLTAQMFHLAYVAVDAEGKADPTRPVTFLFNGGPG